MKNTEDLLAELKGEVDALLAMIDSGLVDITSTTVAVSRLREVSNKVGAAFDDPDTGD